MAKKKVTIEKARVHINATFNNTILTLTDLNGDVITWSTPGVGGRFKGSRKGTPYAAQVATENLAQQMKEYGIKSVVVTINGTGPGKNSVVQTLKGQGFRVENIQNVTPRSYS